MSTATASLFPHLAPDATWTQQQEAGDRMRAIYSKDAAARQAALIGEQNVHLGGVRVLWDHRNKRTIMIGLDYAFSMCRGMIVHRQLARYNRDRAHHVRNALRIRKSLCFWGLCVAL
jgi:hypothetical protein